MSVTNVPIKDLGKYEARLAQDFPRRLRDGMARGARAVYGYLVKQTALAGIRDLGTFQRGWMTVQLSDWAVRVYNAAPHAPWVEFGRLPGKMPPSSALESWTARHLGDARLAFVVARSIGRRGIRARPVMYAPGALGRMSDLMAKHTIRALDEALRP